MRTLINEVCPMFQMRCRHCSEEHDYRPYTEIKRDPATKLCVPIKSGKKKVSLGMFCNDAGEWVEEMHYCPVIWANSQKPTFTKSVNLKQERPIKKKVSKRITRTAKPAKKPIRVKSHTARLVKVSKSPISKKSTSVKKGRGDKRGKNKRTTLPKIIQL
jgi:hypothetical protein